MLAEIIIRPPIELNPASGAGDADGDALMVMGATAENARQPAYDQDDVSIRSAIPSVSDIYPEDSVSVRDLRRRHHQLSWMDDQQSGEPSVVSFRSEDERNLYKEFYGRTFSDHDKYMMPADGDEHSRLDRQHLLHLLYLDGLYPEKELIERTLQPKDPPPGILDVGTGSGRWALDMARHFPHAEVVGLDLVPPVLVTEDEIPMNCRFEVDDANLSLDHFENSFDLVHVRSADTGLNDLNGWFYEIAKTLRPGGLLIIANGSIQKRGADLNPLPLTDPGQPGFSWVQKTWGTIYDGYLNKGNTGVQNPLYWDDYLRKNSNFEHVCRQDYFIPIGPWKPNMSEREVMTANLMREAEVRALHAHKPHMLSQGHEEADVDMWIERAIAEVRDLTLHGYTDWEYSIAMRKDTPWEPRLEVPPVGPGSPPRRLFPARQNHGLQ
ncbi:hypothetical protein FRC01_004075 [Tulasnella sp. 417]|nr:hypothetical protein FRC01_004075 [Tulasnella sp. 417]